ncbi:MAG TPA: ABC transporter permease [Acidimicrobiales bacterium]|nr:ABC transporter permease [Acidimicrobiales bacterium]
MSSVSELAESRELFVNLTLRELRGKYKRSVLGWTWSLLNPLATMVIFTVVFRFFLKVTIEPGDPSGLHVFAIFLLCGLLPWNFLSNGMSGSMGALLANSNLIKKVFFPREILVVSNIASWIVSFLLELGVLAVVLLVAGSFVLPWLLPTLGLVLIQTMFVVGLGLLLSVLNVYFRDVQHLIGILLQIWFYATPIVYPITYVRDALKDRPELFTLYKLNPMVRFVEAYRDCLYDLRFPALLDTLYLFGVSASTLALGIFVFWKLEPKLAEEL